MQTKLKALNKVYKLYFNSVAVTDELPETLPDAPFYLVENMFDADFMLIRSNPRVYDDMFMALDDAESRVFSVSITPVYSLNDAIEYAEMPRVADNIITKNRNFYIWKN
jgi:hypothetical protein